MTDVHQGLTVLPVRSMLISDRDALSEPDQGYASMHAGLCLPWYRRKALAVEQAILLELVPLRWQAAAMAVEVARRHNASVGFDTDFFACWRLSEPVVYPQIGMGLMLLSEDAFFRLGYFQAQLAEARHRLAEASLVGGFAPTPYRFLSSLVRAVNEVQPLMQSPVGRRAAATLPAWPDTAEANACVDSFEFAAQEPAAIPYCWFDCAEPNKDRQAERSNFV